MSRNVGEGRPAATVVIVRDMPGSPPHILMMERAAHMAFAGGALVFPGGAVDEADRTLAAAVKDGDVDDFAARIAAIRETLEESGLGVGFRTPIASAQLMDMRAALAQGESLAAIAEAHGLEFALDQLVPFSRWHPAAAEHVTRIFDTRFYLVRAPRDQEPRVDATENVRLFWSGAQETIARCDAGQGRIIFPTRRNLERLALFDSFDAMAAHASSTPIEMVRPWIEDRAGEPHLCIPENIGYPVTSEPLGGVQRG